MKKLISILIILFLIGGFIYSYIEIKINKDENITDIPKEIKDELESYGYSKKDIKIIRENLNSDEIDEIKTLENKESLLDYINIDYFKIDNLSRYIAYEKANKYTKKDVVMHVNIGMDIPHYTNIKTVKDPHDTLVLVNKWNELPSGITPQNLVVSEESYNPSKLKMEKVASDALSNMINDAKTAGYTLYLVSGYRSEDYQKDLYNYYVKLEGQTKADTYSARQNHSEHQTGLAADIGISPGSFDNFEKSAAYPWVKENSHKYGFIERYPKGKEFIHGYIYEPWHYRYVGTEAAKIIYDEDITFEEYYVKYIEK